MSPSLFKLPAPGENMICAFFARVFIALFLLLPTSCLYAQLCSGSLGDPVVNITFGPGGNSTAYKPPAGYTYANSSCPDDGFYTLTNHTSQCFGDTWHALNEDHTGNKGNFMLVNASFTPGDFFLTTVTDLCPNTNYQFSAWILNLLNYSGLKPDITFSIESTDGTVLQEFSTGSIAETIQPEWKEYGFFFSTPAENATIILRMRNNGAGGLGNDLALDDITFRPCGATITSAIMGHSDVVEFCEGNTDVYTFAGNASDAYHNPAYQWQQSTDMGNSWKDIAGANSEMYVRKPVTNAGVYLYRLTVTDNRNSEIRSCRIASNNLTIHVHPRPIVSAGSDRVLIAGDTIHLGGKVSGEGPSYVWSPVEFINNANTISPIASPVYDMTYTLSAVSSFGCKNEDQAFIKVVKGIFVPSGFTPNGDGKNDRWRIPYLDPLLGAEVFVYNRFGQLLYHTKGQSVDWDGTYHGEMQSSAVFIYQIKFKNGRPEMKGTLTLIR